MCQISGGQVGCKFTPWTTKPSMTGMRQLLGCRVGHSGTLLWLGACHMSMTALPCARHWLHVGAYHLSWIWATSLAWMSQTSSGRFW